MAFKQPRVPEYRSAESMEANIRMLILFLKDFCTDAWAESRRQKNAIRDIAQTLERIQTEKADHSETDDSMEGAE